MSYLEGFPIRAVDALLRYATATTVHKPQEKQGTLAEVECGSELPYWGGARSSAIEWGTVIYIISVIIACPLSLQTPGVRSPFLVLDSLMILSNPKHPILGQASLLSLQQGGNSQQLRALENIAPFPTDVAIAYPMVSKCLQEARSSPMERN